jgi:hypothetical protein
MPRPRSIGLPAAALAVACGLGACAKHEQLGGGEADAAADTDAVAPDASTDGAADRADAAPKQPPCRLGGTRADLPTTIGCAQAPLGRLVVAGGFVYWTVQGAGPIVLRAPLVGGVGEELVRDTSGAFGLAVDDTYVYYTQVSVGRVMRVPLAGGIAHVLAKNVGQPIFLVKDGASLYWTDAEVDGKIVKLDLVDGAQPVTLIDGQTAPRALAVRDGYVYWTDVKDGTLLRTLDHLTGPPDAAVRTANRLATGLKIPTDLVLVGDFAYLPDQNGFIQRVPLGGGDLEPVASTVGAPYGVASDGTSIFWTTLGIPGGIFKAPLDNPRLPDGGVAGGDLIFGGQADPHFVTVTNENVYWTIWGTSPGVARLAR